MAGVMKRKHLFYQLRKIQIVKQNVRPDFIHVNKIQWVMNVKQSTVYLFIHDTMFDRRKSSFDTFSIPAQASYRNDQMLTNQTIFRVIHQRYWCIFSNLFK